MQLLPVGNIPLAVVDEGQGEPVLLVHAFPVDHSVWQQQIESLARRHRVIAPDLRGFGRSPAAAETMTMRQFALDLAGLLDALGVAAPVTVAGISMGGYVALAFWEALPQRVRALILCDTRAAADAPAAAAGRLETAERVLREGCGFLAESMPARLLGSRTQAQRPELVQQVAEIIRRASPQGVAAASRGMGQRPDMTARLKEIQCPALLLVGSEDLVSPPAEMRDMAAALPQAELVEIPGAGHLSPLEEPQAVTRAMAGFLAQVVGSR